MVVKPNIDEYDFIDYRNPDAYFYGKMPKRGTYRKALKSVADEIEQQAQIARKTYWGATPAAKQFRVKLDHIWGHSSVRDTLSVHANSSLKKQPELLQAINDVRQYGRDLLKELEPLTQWNGKEWVEPVNEAIIRNVILEKRKMIKLDEEVQKIINEVNEEKSDTKVFKIDFTKPEAKDELDRYVQEGIEAFTKFIQEGQEGYLCYTIQKIDSRYRNDYPYLVDILYNFGFYENEYKLEATERYNHSSHNIFKRTSKNSKTILANIQKAFQKIYDTAKWDIQEDNIIGKAYSFIWNACDKLGYEYYTDIASNYSNLDQLLDALGNPIIDPQVKNAINNILSF